jgi:hypothetical protein
MVSEQECSQEPADKFSRTEERKEDIRSQYKSSDKFYSQIHISALCYKTHYTPEQVANKIVHGKAVGAFLCFGFTHLYSLHGKTNYEKLFSVRDR